MTGGTARRPFSSLGDQQLLEQTRRLAANQRGLEVHILDHLDEIDRRGLALRRGFSSLFDYAVRELRFTDAAAQRRIQTMRLCRRHGWVRAMLHSGELSVTSAAQLETAFGAAERQCRRASAPVDQERCQALHGLPAVPSGAGDQDAEASGAGMAGAAAVAASAPPGVAAVAQELGDARGCGARHTGSDGCRRLSVEPEVRSLDDAGSREERHAERDRCRRSSADSEAQSLGDAGGRGDRHTESDRCRPSSDGLAAQSSRGVGGREDRYDGNDGCRRLSAGPEARSLGDAGGREERDAESDRCRRSSDGSAAVGARPAAAGAQPVGRWDSSAATSGAAPASTAATLHAPPPAAPGRVPRPGLTGTEAATTPVVPVTSHAAAQHRGARHGDALPARRESSGAAGHSPAPLRASGAAVASSDQGPAAPLLPPARGAEPGPLPVVAPSEPRLTAALAPAPSRGDRNPEPCSDPELRSGPERSAGPVSAAALLHPRRQRELIEQAAGMTTRQVAGLLASAAPQVAPPRDTLRAVAPDRYTLKVSIDQECEQGLRHLKDLRSHVDPRMSWGDLVARLVREAVARHDPRGGGGRRGRTGGTAASSRRERTGTPSVVAAAAAGGEQPRAATIRNAAGVRGVAPAAPTGGARSVGARAGAAVSAPPAVTAAPEGRSAGGGPAHGTGATRIPRATTAPPRLASGGPAGGADATGIRRATSAAPKLVSGGSADGADATPIRSATTAAPELVSGGSADGADATPIRSATTAAPELVSGGSADGADATPIRSATTAAPELASGGSADGADATPIRSATTAAPRLVSGDPADDAGATRIPRATTAAPKLAGGVPPARGAGGTPGRASPQCTRDAPLGPRRSPPRRTIPAAVRRYVWLRDGGRCRYRDPLTGRRCNSSHLLQIHHLLPVAEGGGPEPENLVLACLAHHRMCHA